MKRIWVVLILVLAFCGLADSAYLTQHETSGTPLLCNLTGLSGCNTVAASPYSHLFGVPLAQYGVVFYGLMFVLAALEILVFDRFLRRILQVVSLIGLLFSIWFTFNQVFFIGAFCIYCLISAGIALLVFLFASLIEPMRRVREPAPAPESAAQPFSMPPAI